MMMICFTHLRCLSFDLLISCSSGHRFVLSHRFFMMIAKVLSVLNHALTRIDEMALLFSDSFVCVCHDRNCSNAQMKCACTQIAFGAFVHHQHVYCIRLNKHCVNFAYVMFFSFQTQALALTRPKSELVLSLQNDSVSGGKDSYERQVIVANTLYSHFVSS